MFKNPFSFYGRIRRTEYGLSVIISLLAILIFEELINTNGGVTPVVLFCLALAWFYIAQATKRCHDRGNIGFFAIIPYYYLWMLFADGEPYENKYGPDPKGREIVDSYFPQDPQSTDEELFRR